jgi:hypothetical protein
MLGSALHIPVALDAIAERVGRADNALGWWITHASANSKRSADELADEVKWHLEVAYGQLLLLAEVLQLPVFHAEIRRTFDLAQRDNMFKLVYDGGENESNSWSMQARRYLAIIRAVFASDSGHTITKDLESILRSSTYSITDRRVFGATPQNESEVHLRIECVLRSLFPVLLHKPRLAKPIKNFEPDTGIPSLQTLIEYKFVSDEVVVGQIADELLADTRGYVSREWKSFIYVIYETKRFQPEEAWRQLFRECGVGSNTSLIVICGETPSPSSRPAGTKVAKPTNMSRATSRSKKPRP